MRASRSFWRASSLILVDAVAIGPAGAVNTRLVFDTGSTYTTLVPAIAESIGYTRAAMIKPTAMRTAAAVEPGYLVRLGKLTTLGFTISNFKVNVADLGHDIDGLLGIDFLWHFNFEVRPAERRILLERSAP
jgi:predicted aspartyl protease